jgi:hypothetical protein
MMIIVNKAGSKDGEGYEDAVLHGGDESVFNFVEEF